MALDSNNCNVRLKKESHADILLRLAPILKECQMGGAALGSLVEEICNVCDDNNTKLFVDVLWRVMVIPFVDSRNENMDRLIMLFYEFLTTMGKTDSESNVALLARVLSLCTKYHGDGRTSVRIQICKTAAFILELLQNKNLLASDLRHKLVCMFLQRVEDKSQVVRSYSVKALAILRQFDNDHQNNIKSVLSYHLKWDPCSDVRINVLKYSKFLPEEYADMVEKVGDLNEDVRKAVINAIISQEISFSDMPLEHRETLLQSCLSDTSASVRKTGLSLLRAWIKCDDNLISVLSQLKGNSSKKTMQLVLSTLCSYRGTELFEIMERSLFVNGVIPLNQITEEKAFCWRFIVETYKSQQRLVPDLPTMSAYLKAFTKEFQDISDRESTQNILLELLKIAIQINLEEGGRKLFLTTILELLTFKNLSEVVIKVLMTLLYKYHVGDSSFESDLIETLEGMLESSCTVIPKPQVVDENIKALKFEVGTLIHLKHKKERERKAAVSASNYTLAQQLQEEAISIFQKIEELTLKVKRSVEENAELSEDSTTIKTYPNERLRAAFNVLMVHIRHTKNPSTQVRAFHENYVAKSIFNDEEYIRKQVLTLLTLIGFASKSDAHDAVVVCAQALVFDEVIVKVCALQCIVDLIQQYTFNEFEGNSRLKEIIENVKPKSDKFEGEKKDPFQIFLMNFLFSDNLDLVRTAVTGLIKLLLADRMSSPRMVSTLLLLWSNESSQCSTIHHDVTTWLPLYVKMGLQQAVTVGDALIPCIQKICDSSKDGYIDQASIEKLIIFVTKYTDQNYLANHVSSPQKPQTVHEKIANNILREMRNLGTSSLSLCYAKGLRSLNLMSCESSVIDNLKRKTLFLVKVS